MENQERLRSQFDREFMKRGVTGRSIALFREVIYDYFKEHGRELPWRPLSLASGQDKLVNPYAVLISEVMLQQTQVDRVKEKYVEFLDAFPDFQRLSRASLRRLLRVWQGLGYNRRVLMLKKLAQIVVTEHNGTLPTSPELLEKLPGIGAATAASVAAFAFDKPVVFIETNIRSVFIHFFFPRARSVRDDRLLPLVEKALDRENPRIWYSALMDYGSMLKRQTENPSRRSAHHVRQSKFAGSDRQLRGKILKALLGKPMTRAMLIDFCAGDADRVLFNLLRMVKEGLVVKRGNHYLIHP